MAIHCPVKSGMSIYQIRDQLQVFFGCGPIRETETSQGSIGATWKKKVLKPPHYKGRLGHGVFHRTFLVLTLVSVSGNPMSTI